MKARLTVLDIEQAWSWAILEAFVRGEPEPQVFARRIEALTIERMQPQHVHVFRGDHEGCEHCGARLQDVMPLRPGKSPAAADEAKAGNAPSATSRRRLQIGSERLTRQETSEDAGHTCSLGCCEKLAAREAEDETGGGAKRADEPAAGSTPVEANPASRPSDPSTEQADDVCYDDDNVAGTHEWRPTINFQVPRRNLNYCPRCGIEREVMPTEMHMHDRDNLPDAQRPATAALGVSGGGNAHIGRSLDEVIAEKYPDGLPVEGEEAMSDNRCDHCWHLVEPYHGPHGRENRIWEKRQATQRQCCQCGERIVIKPSPRRRRDDLA